MTKGRRIFDVVCAAAGLIVLAPLFVLIAVAIKVDDDGPIFFHQERVGLGGRLFPILKFRTMSTKRDAGGRPLTVAGDPRVTRAGRWLRRSKLDELPQLFNVLRGQMTLVGPRPEVPTYASLYDDHQRRVLALVPGITDPASIAFRNEERILAAFDDPERGYIEAVMPAKIRLNLEYAAQRNWCTDLVVILRTVASLWSGSDSHKR